MQAATLTNEQLDLRLTGIGASEIAAVCGKNPWMSAIDVWRAKVNGITAPKNIHMERGSLMEPFALRIFNAVRDYCRDLGNDTRRHPEHSWMLATLDGAIMDGFDPIHIVECKAPRERVDSIPIQYRYQMQQQMMVAGVRAASLVSVHGDFHPAMLRSILAYPEAIEAFLDGLLDAEQYTILDMDWDEEIAEEIVEKGREFWCEYVVPQVPPPPDGSESYSAYLAEDEPESDGQIIEADEELTDLCICYLQAKANAEESQKEYKRLQQMIEATAGEHDGCVFAGRRMTWKKQNGRATASAKELEALARLKGATDRELASCRGRGNPFRVFRVKDL